MLDDLLDQWSATYRAPFEGVRVIGTRWSPRSYAMREFLARNHIPYQWVDVEKAGSDPETARMVAAHGEGLARLPVVVLPDGSTLADPAQGELADRLGLRTRPDSNFFDLVIVGGGPAGLAAGVYGASEGLKTVIVEREARPARPGLQIGRAHV